MAIWSIGSLFLNVLAGTLGLIATLPSLKKENSVTMEQKSQSSLNQSQQAIADKILQIKKLLNDQVITQEEYDKLLNEIFK